MVMTTAQAEATPLIPAWLTVVYDDRCQLCQRCRGWLQNAAQLVPLAFVAASDGPGIHQLGLDAAALPVGDELIVVGHTAPGQAQLIWVGPDAFITCLWALAEHRQLAGRLQKPAMRPLAKRAFHALSLGRGTLSNVLAGIAPAEPVSSCPSPPPPLLPNWSLPSSPPS